MLIEFRVQNHRSIREEQVLTMEAAYPGDDDPRVRAPDGHAELLLTAAALYGANASGKTNVLDALGFMQGVVVYSHRMWEPQGGVPRDPFAWGVDAAAPSTFELTFLCDGTRYRYGFVVDDHRVLEEWLHAWPNRRQQTWFARDENEFKYGEHLRGENRLVEQVTRPNALFLSAAAQHQHKQLQPLYQWFRRLQVVHTTHQPSGPEAPSLEQWLSSLYSRSQHGQHSPFSDNNLDSEREKATLLALLRAADVGIIDLKVEHNDEGRGPSRVPPRVLVRHQHSSAEAWLPLDEESCGTQTLLRLAPSLIHALRHGSVVAIDELDASLHPLLADKAIRQFHAHSTNPRNAQIIFTTHNTNLLGTTLGQPLLRRDQIWLTDKDQDGATSVTPMSDFKPRKAENLERGYLQGRYGAVPIFGDLGVVPK